MTKPLPTYFISHGGGPWPWLPQMRAMFVNLEASLNAMVADLDAPPKAILMISGHWEQDEVAVMAACGWDYTLCVTKAGKVFGWGGNAAGTHFTCLVY